MSPKAKATLPPLCYKVVEVRWSFYLGSVPLLIAAAQSAETMKARRLAYPPGLPVASPLFRLVAWGSALLGLYVLVSGYWHVSHWSPAMAFALFFVFFSRGSLKYSLMDGPKLIRVSATIGFLFASIYLESR
jgi:hypothetical protein